MKLQTDFNRGAALQRGDLLKSQGRYKDALREYGKSLQGNPRDAYVLCQVAVCQLRSGGMEEKALETVERAIGLEPDNAYQFALKAHVLCALRQNEKALVSANQALALEPQSVLAHCARSQAYLLLEKWLRAEETAREALAIDAENHMAANLLARSLFFQGKKAENTEHVHKMLARNPEDPHNHHSAGIAALQSGDHPKAERHFWEALRLEPNLAEAREGMLETFRARSPFYRSYLKYAFFMQRLSPWGRLTVIGGLFLVVHLTSMAMKLHSPMASYGFYAIWLLFVLWSYVARSVGNVIIMSDRFARLALTRRECCEGVTVGGGVIVGLLLITLGIAFAMPSVLLLGLCVIGPTIPLALLLTNSQFKGRCLYGGLATIVSVSSLLLAGHALAPGWVTDSFANPAMTVGAIVFAATTWLGMFRVWVD